MKPLASHLIFKPMCRILDAIPTDWDSELNTWPYPQPDHVAYPPIVVVFSRYFFVDYTFRPDICVPTISDVNFDYLRSRGRWQR